MPEPQVIKWLLDTRPLWPRATTTRDLAKEASRALSLLTPQEQSSVQKYHFLRDAKMALASALLKRHAITSSSPRQHPIPWSAALFTRDAHAKPVFRLPDGSEPLLFNVSHQAGLVCLLAVCRPPAGLSLGVDLVCPSERRTRDHALVAEEGWPSFVRMHESVFSAAESAHLRALAFRGAGRDAAGGGADGEEARVVELDRKLGCFYALWCVREAYVKMTGEALLAEWLPELEVRYFAPPGDGAEVEAGPRKLEIWFRGEEVADVHVRMGWCLDEYMVCTAVGGGRDAALDFGKPWTLLDMDELLDAAERADAR